MPSMTSFSGEIASICLGVFVASILIVPALLVAYSADPGKRKVSSLKTIVVLITLSSANAFPSCIAETSFQVPCNRCKSFLDNGSGGLSAAINNTTARIMSNRAFIMISEPELLCNQGQAGKRRVVAAPANRMPEQKRKRRLNVQFRQTRSNHIG